MLGKRKRRRDVGKHKFCPVCGNKLELVDTYCVRCGYSFEARAKKHRKGSGSALRRPLPLLEST